jgi:uncharacterized protein VirK/YbjX
MCWARHKTTPPDNFISLIKQLVKSAALVHPDAGMRDAVWRVKYVLRGLARPGLTRKWFFLLQRRELSAVVRTHPHVLSKLQRPYLHRALGPASRLKALQNHYAFVARHLSGEMVREVYSPAGFPLATIDLEAAGQVHLRLVYRHSSGKEGDLTILIEDGTSRSPIYSLTFSIAVDDGNRREIFVGGIQGFSRAHDEGRVVAVTRAMHGLRPKALAVFTLRQLASAWECTSLRAVSDDMHIYRHYLRRKKIAAHYEEFWRECGGQPAGDRMFDLPLAPPPRPLSEIKASKRQMYKHRHALLEALGGRIVECVSSHYQTPDWDRKTLRDEDLVAECQEAGPAAAYNALSFSGRDRS